MSKPTIVTISNQPQEKHSNFALTFSIIVFVLSLFTAFILVYDILPSSSDSPSQDSPAKSCTVSIQAVNTWANAEEFDNIYTVTKGEKIVLPIPVKLNNTFTGWFSNTSRTLPFDTLTDTVQEDINLYASFETNLYTITLIDPRYYLADGNTVNEDYIPQTFTQKAGSGFSFPELPEPDAVFGECKGWSHSMLYEQPDGTKNVFAQPGDSFENFFRQNITYWAVFEGWDPFTKSDLGDEYLVYFDINPPTEYFAILDETPKAPFVPLYYDAEFEPIPHPSHLPFFISNMPLVILNDGLIAYSFAGWSLSPDYTAGERIYHGGEAVNLETLSDNTLVTLYAVWKTVCK